MLIDAKITNLNKIVMFSQGARVNTKTTKILTAKQWTDSLKIQNKLERCFIEKGKKQLMQGEYTKIEDSRYEDAWRVAQVGRR